jgi:hypothetical protein
MAFGQQAGPPASAKQVAYLLSLVQAAGHDGFRDARGALRLTQRQAGGKFTKSEASELIDRLVSGDGDEAPDGSGPPDAPATAAPARAVSQAGGAVARARERRAREQAELVAALPDEVLADELGRRGWRCTRPDRREG